MSHVQMDANEDNFLSQIAADLENEYFELQQLNNSSDNLQLTQMLDYYELDLNESAASFDIELPEDLLSDQSDNPNVSSSEQNVSSSEQESPGEPQESKPSVSRFAVPVSDDFIENFVTSKKNKNTSKSNKWAVSIFDSWRRARNDDVPDILTMNKDTMCFWLQRFVLEVRTQKGTEYTGKSIYSILCGLLRHLRENKVHDKNFLDEKDPSFAELRKTVNCKMQDLLENGVGTDIKQAEPLSESDESRLWDLGVFGMKDSKTLQYTMFFYSCKLFGLRGKDEHRHLQCSQFSVGSDSKGRFIRFIGRNSKTFKGGLGQMALTNKDIKHYCDDGPRCLATYFELYLSVLGDGNFYRRPLAGDEIRYSEQPVGVNKLGSFMKDIASLGGIDGNFTNHSGKRTCATALFDANVDEQEIMDRTGHRSVSAVRKYKRQTDNVRKRTSRALNPKPSNETEINETVTETNTDCDETKLPTDTNMDGVVTDKIRRIALKDISNEQYQSSTQIIKKEEFMSNLMVERPVQFQGCTFNF